MTRGGTVMLVGFALAALAGTPVQSQNASAPAVIELFTSQGCSSCPAADEILGKLAQRSDVIALSLPVDYWDYLGWRDTLADHAFTERQRAYAVARGDGQVYTPQVVVNGVAHAVGSRIAEIEAAVAKTRAELGPPKAIINVRSEGVDIVIDVGAAEGAGVVEGRLLMAVTSDRVPVQIAKGENRGRTITYYNVVRSLSEIGRWTGGALSVRRSRAEIMAPGIDACFILLQDGTAGPILAAARLDQPRP